MSEEIYTLNHIQTALSPIFRDYHVKSAVLFGSYAKGVPNGNSDIDILVDSGLTGLRFFGLLEEIVTCLEKNVDLIDIRQIEAGSEMQKEIQKTRVVIYG